MTAITSIAAQVQPTHKDAEIRSFVAAAAITAGQPVYIDANGKVNLADANGAGAAKFRGIALESVGAGSPVSVLRRGEVVRLRCLWLGFRRRCLRF